MTKTAALYARVSSARQKENQTIASQVTALLQDAEVHDYLVPPEGGFRMKAIVGPLCCAPDWKPCAIWRRPGNWKWF